MELDNQLFGLGFISIEGTGDGARANIQMVANMLDSLVFR